MSIRLEMKERPLSEKFKGGGDFGPRVREMKSKTIFTPSVSYEYTIAEAWGQVDFESSDEFFYRLFQLKLCKNYGDISEG